MMNDNNPAVIKISDNTGSNELTTSEPSRFDCVIEKRTGRPTNWTNRRIV